MTSFVFILIRMIYVYMHTVGLLFTAGQHANMETEGKKKRARGKNWDDDQKEYLTELCFVKVQIIEDKHTDTNTSNRKKVAWDAILNQFVAKFGTVRTLAQIQAEWRRLKLEAKAQWREHDKSRKATGGGPPPTEPDNISKRIRDHLPQEFTQLINIYDDDYCSPPSVNRQNR